MYNSLNIEIMYLVTTPKKCMLIMWRHDVIPWVDAVLLADFIDVFMCKREDPSSRPPLIGYMAQHQGLTEVAADIP